MTTQEFTKHKNEELEKSLIGMASMTIFAHTSIMFNMKDITYEEAVSIDKILFEFQYIHQDMEKADYLIFAVANKIATRKGLKPLDYFELSPKAKDVILVRIDF